MNIDLRMKWMDSKRDPSDSITWPTCFLLVTILSIHWQLFHWRLSRYQLVLRLRTKDLLYKYSKINIKSVPCFVVFETSKDIFLENFLHYCMEGNIRPLSPSLSVI